MKTGKMILLASGAVALLLFVASKAKADEVPIEDAPEDAGVSGGGFGGIGGSAYMPPVGIAPLVVTPPVYNNPNYYQPGNETSGYAGGNSSFNTTNITPATNTNSVFSNTPPIVHNSNQHDSFALPTQQTSQAPPHSDYRLARKRAKELRANGFFEGESIDPKGSWL